MRHLPRRSLLLACLGLGSAVFPAAAGPGDLPGASPYDPPTLTFPEDRISLMEAIRLTLQNNPDIKIQEQQSRFDLGLAQEATGQFDLTLNGNLSFSYEQSALTKSQLDFEQKRRDDLAERIQTGKDVRQEAIDTRQQYERVLADPTHNELTDPLRQSEIDLLNTLAENSSDPAVKAQYEAIRTQLINREIDVQQQIVSQADVSIAENEKKLSDLGSVPHDQYSMNGSLGLNLMAPQRNGMTLGLFFKGDFSRDRYKGKSKLSDFGGKGVEDVYSYSVGFSLDAALLRNRGVDATGAAEKAAKIDYDASYLAYQQSISLNVLNTVQAYWALASAQEQLDVVRQSYSLQTRRVDVTKALISGDEIPQAELSRVLASQASDQGLVYGAERAVNDARIALAIAMGLSVQEARNAPLAADPLPDATQRAAIAQAAPAPMIAAAIANRNDLKAAFKLEESGGVLLKAAQINLRPLLNFHGDVSAGAVAETAFARTWQGWAGPSFDVALLLSAPIQNNAARGQLLQSDAVWKQKSISRADLDRTIKANVVQDLRSLKNASDGVDETRNAVRYYETTIGTENEKFRMGESTLIDTILTQQLQTSALLAYASAKQQYASLLAQLRFETGTLVGEGPEGSVIRLEDLERLPPVTAAEPGPKN